MISARYFFGLSAALALWGCSSSEPSQPQPDATVSPRHDAAEPPPPDGGTLPDATAGDAEVVADAGIAPDATFHVLVDRTELFDRTATITTDFAVADLNGDNAPDIAWISAPVTSTATGHIDISMNDGRGRYTTHGVVTSSLARGSDWYMIRAGDIDGDADVDLVLSRPAGDGLSELGLLRNDGTGEMAEDLAAFPMIDGLIFGVTYGHPLLTDIDGDTDVDVLLPIFGDDANTRDLPNLVLVNDGAGMFTVDTNRLPALPRFTDFTVELTAGDFDGDTDQDLYLAQATTLQRILQNDGSGHFTDVSSTALDPDAFYAASPVAQDIDEDGDIDIAVTAVDQRGTPRGRAYVNDGHGSFERVLLPAGNPSGGRNLQIIDLDRDGRVELVWSTLDADAGAVLEVARREQGAPAWALAESPISLRETISQFRFTDVDLDGDLDLVVSTRNTRYLFLAEVQR